MADREWLAERFEQQRPRLRAVAYRMLGSASEAEDAVQEAWLRLSGASSGEIDDLGAWLTTVVARVALDTLRSRKRRLELDPAEPVLEQAFGANPEHEALLAGSVGLALLVVLDTLSPAERLAFVLHDVFAMPFEAIAPIVERNSDAVRKLASRARRRVQARHATPDADIRARQSVVDAFVAAAEDGDFQRLVAVLDPEVVLRVDVAPFEVRGAEQVARRAKGFSRLDLRKHPVLVDGAVGLFCTRDGEPFSVVTFAVADGKIHEMHIVRDAARLDRLDWRVVVGR
jgi:RNA polymerase sigma-70 factor (ECF subfamily)